MGSALSFKKEPSLERQSLRRNRRRGASRSGFGEREYNLAARPLQIRFKPMQIKNSKTAFICYQLFFRIGTFQWVTSDSNKKIQLSSGLYSESYRPGRTSVF